MSGDHVDQVHPEVAVMLRNEIAMAQPDKVGVVEAMTDAEVLEAYDRDYPGGVSGALDDLGASPS